MAQLVRHIYPSGCPRDGSYETQRTERGQWNAVTVSRNLKHLECPTVAPDDHVSPHLLAIQYPNLFRDQLLGDRCFVIWFPCTVYPPIHSISTNKYSHATPLVSPVIDISISPVPYGEKDLPRADPVLESTTKSYRCVVSVGGLDKRCICPLFQKKRVQDKCEIKSVLWTCPWCARMAKIHEPWK